MWKRMSYQGWTKEALIERICELEKIVGVNKPESRINKPERECSVPVPRPSKKSKVFDFSKFSTRKVAIRFAYLGWNYCGLAHQNDDKVETVEGVILKALYKTKCISSLDPKDCDFSRCGRTDRDVSALAQVMSLKLRSNLSEEDQANEANDPKELDYLKILNSSLPSDILAYEVCLRPPIDFDARFSCKSRTYRYHFDSQGLDLEAMRAAAQLLHGEHDFRNFCKIDASKQISNYRRTVVGADIVRCHGTSCYLQIEGSAFLWNQVRSIMAILFMIGRKQESVEIVSKLVDVSAHPRRPAYQIAWGVPLMLYDCKYDEMEWKTSAYTRLDGVQGVWFQNMVKMKVAQSFMDVVQSKAEAAVNVDGSRRQKHVPLFERQLLDEPEVVNERWLRKRTDMADM